MTDLVIIGGTVVTPAGAASVDVAIAAGTIQAVGPDTASTIVGQ